MTVPVAAGAELPPPWVVADEGAAETVAALLPPAVDDAELLHPARQLAASATAPAAQQAATDASGIVATLATLSYSAPAAAVELRFATGFPASHLMQKHVFEPWTEEVAKRSNGTLQIRMYPGGALGAAPAGDSTVHAGVPANDSAQTSFR